MLALEPVLAWIDDHQEQMIEDLQTICRQPSVAAADWGMREMLELLVERLGHLTAGVRILPTAGYPVVFARLSGASSRRLALYNHYDVQPPEPLELWTLPPFDAAIQDGRLYARGVADNKGNLVARIWAAQAWREVYGELPCELVFFVEGEEEIGSPHLDEVVAAHQELLAADAWLWEAGYRDDSGALSLYAGVKGILCVELRAQTVAYDLHSSQATLAPNAAWRLIEALGTLCNTDQQVQIPGFYANIVPPGPQEQALMARFPLDSTALMQHWAVDHLIGHSTDPVKLTEQQLYMPTCNICGIWSGYTGPGIKTVLPASASAKLDFRLVPGQDPAIIMAAMRAYLIEQGFGDIEVVEVDGAQRPGQSPIDTPLMDALIRSARRIYPVEPRVLPRIAGTGPMEQLCQRYGVPAIGGAGVGYTGSRIHAPNEHIRIEDFILGVKHVAALLPEFAAEQG